MNKLNIGKRDILDIILGTLYSVLLAVGLILLFAVIFKFTNMSEGAIEPVKIAIKTIAILAGCLLGIRKSSKGAIKGLIIGALFMGITYLIFSLIAGNFTDNNLTIFDAILMLAEGLISGILTVNIKGRKTA